MSYIKTRWVCSLKDAIKMKPVPNIFVGFYVRHFFLTQGGMTPNDGLLLLIRITEFLLSALWNPGLDTGISCCKVWTAVVLYQFMYGFFKTKRLIMGHAGGADNGNGNWCMLGRAFLCWTGFLCVKPCILLPSRVIFCRTSIMMIYLIHRWHYDTSK